MSDSSKVQPGGGCLLVTCYECSFSIFSFIEGSGDSKTRLVYLLYNHRGACRVPGKNMCYLINIECSHLSHSAHGVFLKDNSHVYRKI